MTITDTTADFPAPQKTPTVYNRIISCRSQNANNNSKKDPANLAYLVIHKTSLALRDPEANPFPIPNELLDGPSLAGRFTNPKLGTGGLIPYEILVRGNEAAAAEQLLPLYIRGAHAIGYSWRSIAIAVVCQDELTNPDITPAQRDRLVKICTALVPLGQGLKIVGHTDLPSASADPRKVCPGSKFALDMLTKTVYQSLPDDWRAWSLAQREEHASSAGFQLL
jgi:hypothetical protein